MTAEALQPDSRNCERCGNLFALPDKGAGRTRRMCHNCSPPILKYKPGQPISASPVLPQLVQAQIPYTPPVFSSDIETPPPERVVSDLERIVTRELGELEVLDTSEGELAVRMCRALDDPELTGTQIASLVKTLYAHLKMVREMAPVIDEDEEAAKEALVIKLSRRL